MITKFCDKLTAILASSFNLTSEQKANLNYGTEILVRFIIEFILIIIVAYIFNILVPVLISSITFITLRTKAGGAHFHTYFQCVISSILAFFIIGMIVKYTPLSLPFLIIWLLLVTVISLHLINKFAPADTEKIPIKDPQTRKKMKKISQKIIYVWLIISLILLFIPGNNLNIIFAGSLGILMEVISIHPRFAELINTYFPEEQ